MFWKFNVRQTVDTKSVLLSKQQKYTESCRIWDTLNDCLDSNGQSASREEAFAARLGPISEF